jgi:hypothetical protein
MPRLTLPIENWYAWIEKKSSNRYYPIYLAIILMLISLFLAFPRFDLYRLVVAWDVTYLKADDLTNNLSHIAPDSFMAKKVFRLTVPVIMKTFHLNREMVIAIQFILGFLFLLVSYKLARRILKDPVSATFVAGGITFLYCGRACFTDISYTWFDGWAYFFLLLSIYYRNIFLVFLFATMAAWVDERAFMSLPIAIIFHQVSSVPEPFRFRFIDLIRLNKSSIAVVVAILGYLGLRYFLSTTYNMHTPSADADFHLLGLNFTHTTFGFGAYTFLEGFWILFPVVLYAIYKNRNYLLLLVMLAQIGILSFAAFSVTDITRSGSYLFGFIFIFLLYLSRFFDLKHFRLLLLAAFFFCFIFPPINYVAFGDFDFRIEKPFAWVIYNMFRMGDL